MTEPLRPSVRSLLEEKRRERDALRRRREQRELLASGRLAAELRRTLVPLEHILAPYELFLGLERRLAEARELGSGPDPELSQLGAEEAALLEQELSRTAQQIIERLVSGEDEAAGRSMIVEIRAGTGGEEAGLFARDLLRMYTRFAEIKGWRVELLAASETERGGFREVSFSVTGEDAWRLLRFESGGHRVQRVPETETQGRIHTSAATVAVLPEPEEGEGDIPAKDLRIDTMRASGPGGQHVNKTSSAVRITHEPTGLVVTCQDEKSQHKNRAKAMRVLRSRLFDRDRREKAEARAEQRRSLIGTGDRNERIRTYNFPQNRVTDHRLKENFNLAQVLSGKLDPLLEELIDLDKEERIKAL